MMATLQEIEMRAQLARRDARIQELERKLESTENQRDQLLDVTARAVRRLEIAQANGESIMREWIIDARAAIASVKGGQ